MTLTYTPPRTVVTPASYTDDETGKTYRVWHDEGTEDPRGWISDDDMALYLYNAAWHHGTDWEPPVNVAAKAFAQFYGRTGDDNRAEAMTARYLRLFYPDDDYRIGVFSLHGYSQSDWWDVFVAVKGDGWGTPESHAQEWGIWARGDVFVVTNVETGESLGGIYAESEEDAVNVFMEQES